MAYILVIRHGRVNVFENWLDAFLHGHDSLLSIRRHPSPEQMVSTKKI